MMAEILFAVALVQLPGPSWPRPGTAWSYPPRAWPGWEVLKARAHTYSSGMYVGYSTVLADAMKCATFRDRAGRTVTVSAASQGGVPCLKGEGFEVLDERAEWACASVFRDGEPSDRWVKCDVFMGTDDTPPHLLGFPAARGTPVLKDGLYEASGETVAFIFCKAAKRPVLRVGESREEALNEDLQWFEQSVRMEPTGVPGEWRSAVSLAFRYYRFTEPVEETWFVRDEKLAPLTAVYDGGDERLNRVWRASAETIRLCSRRFFVDAVKRDRMPWSGDQAIAFLADSATYRDAETARFTIDALGCAKSDGFVDYSPWWVILNGLYRRLYDDIGFVAARRNVLRFRTDRLAEGFRADGLKDPGSHLFMDWGERGNPTTAYNVLCYGAFATAAALADEIGEREDAARWAAQAARIKAALLEKAYDARTGLFKTDVLADGEKQVFRHANLLAVLFGLVSDDAARRIGDVLAKDDLPKVGSTWMIGLENVALLVTGHRDVVRKRIETYWSGMIDRGFNTQFEHWWPNAKGAESYWYYDRPFGLSLCHVTAASPAFLLPALEEKDFRNPFAVRLACDKGK